jgi:hypothetical protein
MPPSTTHPRLHLARLDRDDRPWERRRFRPNILLDGEGEDVLVGSRVTLGEATLHVGLGSSAAS